MTIEFLLNVVKPNCCPILIYIVSTARIVTSNNNWSPISNRCVYFVHYFFLNLLEHIWMLSLKTNPWNHKHPTKLLPLIIIDISNLIGHIANCSRIESMMSANYTCRYIKCAPLSIDPLIAVKKTKSLILFALVSILSNDSKYEGMLMLPHIFNENISVC